MTMLNSNMSSGVARAVALKCLQSLKVAGCRSGPGHGEQVMQAISPAAEMRSWQLKLTRWRPNAAAAAVAAVVRPDPEGPASSRATLTLPPLAPCTPSLNQHIRHLHLDIFMVARTVTTQDSILAEPHYN